MKDYVLKYKEPAPLCNENQSDIDRSDNQNDGWEKWALPIGNSYMGVMVFGRTVTERWQFTENSFCRPSHGCREGGLNNFVEVYLDFHHDKVENFQRSLSLNDAITRVQYDYEGVTYSRDCFCSYKDKVFVSKISASKKQTLNFTISGVTPFLELENTYEVSGDKTGEVKYISNEMIVKGTMSGYQLVYYGKFHIQNIDGEVITTPEGINIKQATEVIITASLGTNYQLKESIFLEKDNNKKLVDSPLPYEKVEKCMQNSLGYSYDQLLQRHLDDYHTLFNRCELNLYGEDDDISTDDLVATYRSGFNVSQYLEELYFQYGRYLLISSSRKNAYPANLQGTWNRYHNPPWTAGIWHNINVQMNYWPALSTNVKETFDAYLDYFMAYLPRAKEQAKFYVKHNMPENYEGDHVDYGWCIGTGASPYHIGNCGSPLENRVGHSGPGTGAFTAQLFWDLYQFTEDERILKEVTYPILKGMSTFLSYTLIKQDGKYLTKMSASPENRHKGVHHTTVGCGFDQQMTYENFKNTLFLADKLGDDGPIIKKIRNLIDKLDPVQVGASGQIKEYREETYYSEYGDPLHRHISQLVCIHPLTIVNSSTPEYVDAVKRTLDLRGDESTGWAIAHRLNVWARTKDGERSYKILLSLLRKGTLTNLLDTHTPYQIDGNLGGTAGIAEMLLQSHEGYIEVIPAIPGRWHKGEFKGLVARGNFVVDAKWECCEPKEITVSSNKGNRAVIKSNKMPKTILCDDKYVSYSYNNSHLTFETEVGKKYILRY
ncbi:glycosyl hydrolase family 95 catalytic domain-containing protein [Vallitalea okinawensis]|uniref:glycosyl hydrolase family 95 catalytic domain-containing protein n=1 Tax=Vallitalea okinawensis TaxID=2078660 RepID=UPI000CFB5ABD|nr:glycoside hydrolase N-terminal domain-containing protein [Vallitalea okinawensis]